MGMAWRGGEIEGDVILEYYPSNITLSTRCHKTTKYQVQTVFFFEIQPSSLFAQALI